MDLINNGYAAVEKVIRVLSYGDDTSQTVAYELEFADLLENLL